MVIGERFAWAHLPKTGGDATHAMLHEVPGLIRFADPLTSHEKHVTFWAREDEVRDKLLVMNIRRLPDWTLSVARHRARAGRHPEHRPEPMPSLDELAESTEADDTLRWMTDAGRFEVVRWLRTERLTDDVIALLDELGALDAEVAAHVRAVGRVNTAPEDDASAPRFNEEQVGRLYQSNPEWSEVERAAFGAVPIER
jgi:hypothetical protein